MTVDIIEAMSDLGVTVDGADKGPEAIMKNIKDDCLEIYKVKKMKVAKEKEKENKKKNLKAINEFNSRLYSRVLESLNNGHIPVTIGGDHSIAIASALASIEKNKSIGIIWCDAHGDFNTFETTITGNIHGLPLAAITGYEKNELTKFHEGANYSPQKTVIIGARDLDKLEIQNLKDAGVTVFSSDDIKKNGVKNIIEKAIQIANNNTNGIHISFDIDLIDPKVAPGVSVPAVDGISEKQAYEILDNLLEQREKIKSIDVVEFNPLRDIEKKTETIATNVVSKICKAIKAS